MLSGETAHTESTPPDMLPKKDEKVLLEEEEEIKMPNEHKPAIFSPHTINSTDSDPLRPNPGTEDKFEITNNVFGFAPGHLIKLYNPKSLSAYKALGGICGIEKALQTDIHAGLSSDETSVGSPVTFEQAVAAGMDAAASGVRKAVLPKSGAPPASQTTRTSSDLTAKHAHDSSSTSSFSDRKRVFGTNVLPAKSAKSLLRLMWEQYNDKILILLTIAAIVSLALGLYETFGMKEEPIYINGVLQKAEPKVNWIEGVAIVVAIVIVVLVGSLNDWQKERQFVKLNAKVSTFCILKRCRVMWKRVCF